MKPFWISPAISVFIVFWGLTPPSWAQAQSQFNLAELQSGQILLNLSATESIQVPQDTLQATLEYSAQGADRTAIQAEVNSAIREALQVLENSNGIKFSTLQYYVYALNPGRGQGSQVWRAQQGLRLESTDSVAVLDLVGALQGDGLHVTSLSYKLSDQAYEQASQSLMQAALSRLQVSAQETANQLGKGQSALIEVSLDGNRGGGGYPMMRAMAMEADSMQTPSASPGETTVSVTVTAKALLAP